MSRSSRSRSRIQTDLAVVCSGVAGGLERRCHVRQPARPLPVCTGPGWGGQAVRHARRFVHRGGILSFESADIPVCVDREVLRELARHERCSGRRAVGLPDVEVGEECPVAGERVEGRRAGVLPIATAYIRYSSLQRVHERQENEANAALTVPVIENEPVAP